MLEKVAMHMVKTGTVSFRAGFRGRVVANIEKGPKTDNEAKEYIFCYRYE
jgi:hypothetical protein